MDYYVCFFIGVACGFFLSVLTIQGLMRWIEEGERGEQAKRR